MAETKTNQPTFGPPKSAIRDIFEQLLITVVMALFLMTFIAQAVAVPTGSMQNTINIGDHLFVNKFIFGKPTPGLGKLLPTREIQRGDIIVFKLPSDPKTNYVKRVIGLPGDTVLVKGRHVIVNGKEIPEERVIVDTPDPRQGALKVEKVQPKPAGAWYKVYYVEGRSSDEDRPGVGDSAAEYAVKEPTTVPPDKYFVMGDSRDNSLDSRYWGFVPRENIFARALYVHLSFDPSVGDPEKGATLLDKVMSIRFNRIGTAVK
ncbi:MAG: signal peptidase I [Acidobacteria bacterium]|nr:signal peptidase I [Acidobacteriota bacterium]